MFSVVHHSRLTYTNLTLCVYVCVQVYMCSCGCLCVCMCVQARDQLPALFLRHHTPCVLKQSLIPGPGPYQLASPRGLTFFLHCAGLTNAHYHNWLFVLHMN